MQSCSLMKDNEKMKVWLNKKCIICIHIYRVSVCVCVCVCLYVCVRLCMCVHVCA